MKKVNQITYRVFEVTEETEELGEVKQWVRYGEKGWYCSCRVWQPQHKDCEDILAVKEYLRDTICHK